MRKVALKAMAHLWGCRIRNAIVIMRSNDYANGMNSKIQWIKQCACGFRNEERFRNAVNVHLSGLDLYPRGIRRG